MLDPAWSGIGLCVETGTELRDTDAGGRVNHCVGQAPLDECGRDGLA
jgi:hypothetical protein